MTLERYPTTHLNVCEAVVLKLLATYADLKPETCFLTLDPELPFELGHNLFVTVTPIGGEFDISIFDGQAQFGTNERASVVVTVWTAIRLDQKGKAAAALGNAARGLLPWKWRILKTFSGLDLQDADGKKILTALMAPLRAIHPSRMEEGEKHLGISIVFATDFDWDLTT